MPFLYASSASFVEIFVSWAVFGENCEVKCRISRDKICFFLLITHLLPRDRKVRCVKRIEQIGV